MLNNRHFDNSDFRFDRLLGYEFTYPFFTEEVGIQYNGNNVRPLYKQILNIEHPTMAFIGVPLGIATNHLYDLQVNLLT